MTKVLGICLLLAAVLGRIGPAAAQQSKNQAKAAAQQSKNQAKAEVLLQEGQVLKTAWIYLELANANYAGHRVKAMNHVKAAVHALDKGVAKNGTGQQTAIATADDIAGAKVKFLREHAPKVTNPQALSDLYMKQAAALLVEMQKVFAQRKQPKMLDHVNKALKETQLAAKAPH